MKTTWNKTLKASKMKKADKKDYIKWLLNIGECQICGSSEIDIPHHVGIGVKRDDRDQVLLCVGCHRKIHNSLFTWYITPDLEEMKYIAKENWRNYNI